MLKKALLVYSSTELNKEFISQSRTHNLTFYMQHPPLKATGPDAKLPKKTEGFKNSFPVNQIYVFLLKKKHPLVYKELNAIVCLKMDQSKKVLIISSKWYVYIKMTFLS